MFGPGFIERLQILRREAWAASKAGAKAGAKFTVKQGAKTAWSGVRASYTESRNAWDAARVLRPGGPGLQGWQGALKGFGTTGNMMIAGAGVGFVAGGPDHRMRGMAYGAAGGAAARAGAGLYFAKQAGALKGLAPIGFGVVGMTALGLGLHSSQTAPEASAHYNQEEDGGYFATPGAGPDDSIYENGVRDRQRSMGSRLGDVVLGSHGLRHG
jgi:hypothetical protein